MAKYAGEYLYENLNNHLPLSSLSAVVYNVKAYGAKGDGAIDDTIAVQAAVNAANADGASLVFFPPGVYKVVTLSNTSTIIFVGDNASFLGYSGIIGQIGVNDLSVFNVKAYGAKGDGVTDDTTAIQNTINAAATMSGVVFFPPTTSNVYKISSTLSNFAGKLLILHGQGSMVNPNDINDAPYVPATKISWSGASNDPMVKITGPIGSCEVKGMTFDGNNTASYGLILDTVQFSNFDNLGFNNMATAGLWLNTVAQQGGSDPNVNTMFNTFQKIATANCPIGIILDGNPVNGSNSCHNTFLHVKTDFTGVAGVRYVRSDNNAIYHLYTFKMSGTGYGVQIEANSYSEQIFHLEGQANGVTGNQGLMIWGYDRANGQAAPVGTGINWTEMGQNSQKWFLSNPIQTPTILPIASGGLSILGRTIEMSFSTTASITAGSNTLSLAGAPSGVTQITAPIHYYPIAMSVSFSDFISAGSITIDVLDNGSSKWSKTITYPSGNNRYFSFSQSTDVSTPIQQGHGLSVSITATGLTPTTLQALVSMIFAF